MSAFYPFIQFIELHVLLRKAGGRCISQHALGERQVKLWADCQSLTGVSTSRAHGETHAMQHFKPLSLIACIGLIGEQVHIRVRFSNAF